MLRKYLIKILWFVTVSFLEEMPSAVATAGATTNDAGVQTRQR